MLVDWFRVITPVWMKEIVHRSRGGLSQLLIRLLNDERLACEPLAPQVFRVAKAKAVASCGDEIRDAFQWTLHDTDGRGAYYQEWQGDNSVHRWLSLYRSHHFIWKRPKGDLVVQFEDRIKRLGRQTWNRMFRRYWLHHLQKHDTYSLPDVYYCCKTLGRIPRVAMDIGGGGDVWEWPGQLSDASRLLF